MELEQSVESRTLILRINRPEAANSITPTLLAALGNALADADADDSVRAIIITGQGGRTFCAGRDMRSFGQVNDVSSDNGIARYDSFVRTGIAKPVIAAVNGAAVAGGFELMLACDLTVAADHARFGLPEVKRGLFAASGGLLLPSRLPLAIALELALTGDYIDAARAYEIGLVNRVVAGPEVLKHALDYARRIGANGPLAVRVSKQLMTGALDVSRADAWRRQDELRPLVFGSADAIEGALAFVEKRDPCWTGR